MVHPSDRFEHGLSTTVGVVGVGLIGGSIVQACLAQGRTVLVADRNEAARRSAVAAGAVAVELAELRARADVVFLCVPPGGVLPLWEAWVDAPPSDAAGRSLVLDVSSVKAPVAEALQQRGLPTSLPDTVFMLSHPMAGREQSGWGAAQAHLFEGANWVLLPDGNLTGDELVTVIDLVESLGARACFMAWEFHDRFAAVTSHVPHVLSFTYQRLVDEIDPTGWRRFAGNSLQDVLRLSVSSPDLWTEILAGNSRELAPLLRELADRLERFDPITDVAAGRPRPPTAGEPLELVLSRHGLLGDQLEGLLTTGVHGLALTGWECEPQVVRLQFSTPVASRP